MKCCELCVRVWWNARASTSARVYVFVYQRTTTWINQTNTNGQSRSKQEREVEADKRRWRTKHFLLLLCCCENYHQNHIPFDMNFSEKRPLTNLFHSILSLYPVQRPYTHTHIRIIVVVACIIMALFPHTHTHTFVVWLIMNGRRRLCLWSLVNRIEHARVRDVNVYKYLFLSSLHISFFALVFRREVNIFRLLQQ